MFVCIHPLTHFALFPPLPSFSLIHFAPLFIAVISFNDKNSGLLSKVHQQEDNLWMVMDRRTNSSRLLSSGDVSFVNNHFWASAWACNCSANTLKKEMWMV